jgi:hypothetical protein
MIIRYTTTAHGWQCRLVNRVVLSLEHNSHNENRSGLSGTKRSNRAKGSKAHQKPSIDRKDSQSGIIEKNGFEQNVRVAMHTIMHGMAACRPHVDSKKRRERAVESI